MGKLVRDKIPEIIQASGQECEYHVIEDENIYFEELKKKLVEETNEFVESNNVEELADVEEVLLALLEVGQIKQANFERIRKSKAKRNGKFEKRFYLDQVKKEEN